MAVAVTQKELRQELAELRDSFTHLPDDQLFVLWFLRAYLTDDENAALAALTGGSKDKGIDAILLDNSTKTACLVQAKYRHDIGGKSESRADVMSFAYLASDLAGDDAAFSRLCKGLSPEVHDAVGQARRALLTKGFRLQLYYVTTAKCSAALSNEADKTVRYVGPEHTFHMIDGRQVLRLLSDYLDGVAPPVPTIELDMESGAGVDVKGVLQRYDSKTDIESWVFSMTAPALSSVFEVGGSRLFARNVRGFLGSTEINRGMESTLREQPEYFWYYNNGVTIVCDHAEEMRTKGRTRLTVTNPQIINGQQTTRTLARAGRSVSASVLVRVIRVPRDENGRSNHFDTLVSRIVGATNWQNAIRASDLMANDRVQIELERQLRKLGYWYVRKRQPKGEAKRLAGKRFRILQKEELAQAVAACDLDPVIVREGKERLFEEKWYGTVFPKADPFYYLVRYRLMWEVGYAARGFPERAYAKWLVLHFLWARLAPLVRSRSAAARFIRISERAQDPINRLFKAIEAVFVGALRFYRHRRGKGAKATDVSTFFKRRGLDREFEQFWRGSANNSRGRFATQWNRFTEGLEEEPE